MGVVQQKSIDHHKLPQADLNLRKIFGPQEHIGFSLDQILCLHRMWTEFYSPSYTQKMCHIQLDLGVERLGRKCRHNLANPQDLLQKFRG